MTILTISNIVFDFYFWKMCTNASKFLTDLYFFNTDLSFVFFFLSLPSSFWTPELWLFYTNRNWKFSSQFCSEIILFSKLSNLRSFSFSLPDEGPKACRTNLFRTKIVKKTFNFNDDSSEGSNPNYQSIQIVRAPSAELLFHSVVALLRERCRRTRKSSAPVYEDPACAQALAIRRTTCKVQ